MRYGMNLLLWADTLTDEALPLLDQIKQIGFDAVELPVFEVDVEKYAKWGKHLDNAGPGPHRRDRPRRGRQPDEPRPQDPPQGRRGQQGRAGLLPGGRRRGAGRAVSLRPGLLQRRRPHEGRMELGRRQHAAGGRARRKVQGHAGAGVPQPLRVLPAEHGRRRRPLLPRREPPALQDDVRHVPLPHRGEEHAGGDPRAEGLPGPRPHFRERPQHAGLGQRPLGRNLRHAARDRLRQPDGDRGLRAGAGEAPSGHENLAADVRERASTGRRRTEVHEGRSRQAVEIGLRSQP